MSHVPTGSPVTGTSVPTGSPVTGASPAEVLSRLRLGTGVSVAVIVAVAVRLMWAHHVGGHPPQGLYDPARYLGYARVIADGEGLIEPLSGRPTAYYPPGYPWFLGGVAWIGSVLTDDIHRLVLVVQAVLGGATVLVGAHIAHRLAGMRAATAAAWGLALYPNLIFHSGAVLGETLYNFLFLTFLLLVIRLGESDSPGRAAAFGCGLVLGAAVMVRPIAGAMVPALLAVWLLRAPDRGRALRLTGLVALGVMVCIAPWTVRNTVRMGHMVVLSTNTGDNLCIGHAEGANGSFTFNDPCLTDHSIVNGPDDEVAADREKTGVALAAIAEDPGRQPWLLWRRFWFTWVRDGDHDGLVAVQSYMSDSFLDADTHRRLAYGADLVYWAVCAAGVAGLVVVLGRRRTDDLVVVAAVLVNALVPLAFFGDSRFKVPVIPLLVILGGVALASLSSRPRAPDPPLRAPTER